MHDLLREQYGLVRQTRETLFNFFESMPMTKLHTEVSGCGFGTIARTHLHVAGCYMHWLVKFAQIRSTPEFPTETEIQSADAVALRRWFQVSDEIVDEFLTVYEGRLLERIYNKSEDPTGLTPLWLMSHTMTHEFHHKGQIVTMVRQLGYVPPDTDLVVPANEDRDA